MAKLKRKEEQGMALLLTLFALLLLSAIGLFMMLSSGTETRIDANYGSSLRAYYAARSGVEEVRDRMKSASSSPGGLADLLPQDIAGNKGGVLYVLNPSGGETIDPTDVTSLYFDDDLCHAYNSGTPKGIKCSSVPTTQGWQLPAQLSQLSSMPNSAPLGIKWVRINMKTNRTADPYFVDQTGSNSTLETRVCWDGQTEQLSPNGSCDANGMQTVYMLAALATLKGATGPNGAKKLLQLEVVAPSIRPAGAVTASSLNVPGSTLVPSLAVDGRVHTMAGSLPQANPDGTLPAVKGCSSVAALATDTGSSQLETALNQIRLNLVSTANASCTASGASVGTIQCTPALAWVRGTGSSPRFGTGSSTSGTNTSGSNTSGSNSGDGHGNDGNSPSKTGTGSGGASYTSLDLSAPQLYGLAASPSAPVAPFIGKAGNQADGTIYQPGAAQTVTNELAAVQNLVKLSQGQTYYYTIFPAALGLNSAFGSSDPTHPVAAIVADGTPATDTTTVFSIPSNTTLAGTGVLVITNALEISGTLKWNGIVVVNSPNGHVTIGSGAQGYINGAVLLAPGATFNFPGGSANFSGGTATPNFTISYSCDAIDLPFNTLPFKIISTAESSN